MKHLFVTMDFAPSHGGVARYYEHLVRTFPKNTVTVLAPTAKEANDDGTFGIFREKFFSHNTWPRWWPLLSVLRKYLQNEKPDFLHVGQVLPVGTAAVLANRRFRIPMVVYTHGMDLRFAERRFWRRWIARQVLQKAHFVVANSAFTARCVSRFGVPSERIVTVLPGISLWPPRANEVRIRQLRADLSVTKEKTVLLSVARLVERKGIADVLSALAAIPPKNNIVYCIVGDGPEREKLEGMARHLGLRNNVRFFGAADDETLQALYALCDVFVLPPKALDNGRDVEGFGMVFLEANAFGKPVIATDTGGVSDAVLDGVTGTLLPQNDPRALQDAMTTFIEDQEKRKSVGASAYEYVEKNCQWAQRAEPLFRNLGVR